VRTFATVVEVDGSDEIQVGNIVHNDGMEITVGHGEKTLAVFFDRAATETLIRKIAEKTGANPA
jgi:hypothetical protein